MAILCESYIPTNPPDRASRMKKQWTTIERDGADPNHTVSALALETKNVAVNESEGVRLDGVAHVIFSTSIDLITIEIEANIPLAPTIFVLHRGGADASQSCLNRSLATVTVVCAPAVLASTICTVQIACPAEARRCPANKIAYNTSTDIGPIDFVSSATAS